MLSRVHCTVRDHGVYLLTREEAGNIFAELFVLKQFRKEERYKYIYIWLGKIRALNTLCYDYCCDIKMCDENVITITVELHICRGHDPS